MFKILSIAVVTIAIFVGGALFYNNRDAVPASPNPVVNEPVSVTPKPTPVAPSPTASDDINPALVIQSYVEGPTATGKSFKVGGGDASGPRIVGGFINPYRPMQGDNQVLNIQAIDQVPVSSVTLTLRTDNDTAVYPMKLLKGTNLDGEWQASWKMNDTYMSYYSLAIVASSSRGETKIEMNF